MGKIKFFNTSLNNDINISELISEDSGNIIKQGNDSKLYAESPKIGENGSSYSITKHNVKSGDEIIINKGNDVDYLSPGVISVWKIVEENIENQLTSIEEYNNSTKDNFIENEFIDFSNNNMKLKTDYSKNTVFKYILDDFNVCSITVNLNDYKKFEVI